MVKHIGKIILGSAVLIALAWLVIVSSRGREAQPSPADTPSPTVSPEPVPTPEPPPPPAGETTGLIEPIDEFKTRITKKFFGTFITPENSPVQPERFRGHHTGVDVEYGDVGGEVEVRAITEGKVVVSRIADGYGGVVIIEHTIDGNKIPTVYGHLDPASMVKNGATVKKGERVGILGDGGTGETDGERKHLHFAMRKESVSLLGYVQKEADLSAWYDPLTFFK